MTRFCYPFSTHTHTNSTDARTKEMDDPHHGAARPPPPPPQSASWLLDARREIDAKAKPPGSLGLLEDWAVQISNIQQTLQPHITAARLLIFAGMYVDWTSCWGMLAVNVSLINS